MVPNSVFTPSTIVLDRADGVANHCRYQSCVPSPRSVCLSWS
jgi:hypothetical protein